MAQRRKYHDGHCQDCGHHKRVTPIIFWATGMKYTVCADCLRPYKNVILKPAAKPLSQNPSKSLPLNKWLPAQVRRVGKQIKVKVLRSIR